MDCLLFGTTIKNKSHMFHVQFSEELQEEALERCCSCVQTLAQYVTVQTPDSMVHSFSRAQAHWGRRRPREGPTAAGTLSESRATGMCGSWHWCSGGKDFSDASSSDYSGSGETAPSL
ncbi:Meiotic recombination protein REC114 [Lemmus lemmus]